MLVWERPAEEDIAEKCESIRNRIEREDGRCGTETKTVEAGKPTWYYLPTLQALPV